MSNDVTKENHSKRIHQKQTYVKKQTRIAKAHGLPIKGGQEHRLQDHAAVNCGIPGCVMCANPRKIWKEKTVQEKRFYQNKLWDDNGED